MIGSWFAYAAASDPDRLPYDLSFWRAGAGVVGTSLAAWLAHRRSKAALPVAAVTAVGTLALGAINRRRKGTYVTRTWREDSPKEKIFNRVMPVVQTVESAALVGACAYGELARRRTDAAPAKGPLFSDPWYPTVRRLGLYYMTFAFLGHWGEMLFCTGIKHGLFKGGYDRENHMLWDQWLFPFPAEGTAAVLADLTLLPAKRALHGRINSQSDMGYISRPYVTPLALVLSFLLNQAVCTSIDFGTGMVANRNYELWDYRDMKFNFMGQICLQNSLFYSIVATWGIWRVLPALEKIMDRAGDTVLDGTLVGLGSFFAFLELIYHVLPRDREGAASTAGASSAGTDGAREATAANGDEGCNEGCDERGIRDGSA